MIYFIDNEGTTLFVVDDGPVPRAGETVLYSHTAQDNQNWNPESLEQSVALDGREWTVVKVWYEFQRRKCHDLASPTVFVELAPAA